MLLFIGSSHQKSPPVKEGAAAPKHKLKILLMKQRQVAVDCLAFHHPKTCHVCFNVQHISAPTRMLFAVVNSNSTEQARNERSRMMENLKT